MAVQTDSKRERPEVADIGDDGDFPPQPARGTARPLVVFGFVVMAALGAWLIFMLTDRFAI